MKIQKNWPAKGCTAKRSTIERVEVVGPMAESKAVMAQLYDDGFTIRSQGPYSDRRMFPKVDVTRFKFTAEREVEG